MPKSTEEEPRCLDCGHTASEHNVVPRPPGDLEHYLSVQRLPDGYLHEVYELFFMTGGSEKEFFAQLEPGVAEIVSRWVYEYPKSKVRKVEEERKQQQARRDRVRSLKPQTASAPCPTDEEFIGRHHQDICDALSADARRNLPIWGPYWLETSRKQEISRIAHAYASSLGLADDASTCREIIETVAEVFRSVEYWAVVGVVGAVTEALVNSRSDFGEQLDKGMTTRLKAVVTEFIDHTAKSAGPGAPQKKKAIRERYDDLVAHYRADGASNPGDMAIKEIARQEDRKEGTIRDHVYRKSPRKKKSHP